MAKEKTDSLAVVLDTKELGTKLIDMAREEERDAMQKAVIGGVRAIMADITKYKNVIAEANDRIAKQERRLKALNAGEFTVKYDVNIAQLKVEFADESLRGL